MLVSLPLAYLILMAAAATFVFSFAMAKWIPGRKGKIVFPAVSVACCLGMILAGQLHYQHWSPQHMLVQYSFGWVGLTVGLFPSRKLMHRYAEEINRGVKREKYDVPKRYTMFAVMTVIVMSFVASLLS
ncbi:hypothetical protein [Streptomyces chrestomyceticus]|uniref:hypothetical protein n=1 Tax=Streptomyces chrestomyceticus TaxID=68185 RepID=UPI0035A889B5